MFSFSSSIEQFVGAWRVMVEKGDQRLGVRKGTQSFGDGDRTWASMVQGTPQGSPWMSHRIFFEEIEQLKARISKVLELLASVLEASGR